VIFKTGNIFNYKRYRIREGNFSRVSVRIQTSAHDAVVCMKYSMSLPIQSSIN